MSLLPIPFTSLTRYLFHFCYAECVCMCLCILHPLPALFLFFSIQHINNWWQAADWHFSRVVNIYFSVFVCVCVIRFWVWIIRNWNKPRKSIFHFIENELSTNEKTIADCWHQWKYLFVCAHTKFLSVKRVESKKEKERKCEWNVRQCAYRESLSTPKKSCQKK